MGALLQKVAQVSGTDSLGINLNHPYKKKTKVPLEEPCIHS